MDLPNQPSLLVRTATWLGDVVVRMMRSLLFKRILLSGLAGIILRGGVNATTLTTLDTAMRVEIMFSYIVSLLSGLAYMATPGPPDEPELIPEERRNDRPSTYKICWFAISVILAFLVAVNEVVIVITNNLYLSAHPLHPHAPPPTSVGA